MSFGRNIIAQSIGAPDGANPESIDAGSILEHLGVIGSNAAGQIISDIELMIERKLETQLDGYVLAISRVLKSTNAAHCIETAYKSKNMSVPDKYTSHLGNANQ